MLGLTFIETNIFLLCFDVTQFLFTSSWSCTRLLSTVIAHLFSTEATLY